MESFVKVIALQIVFVFLNTLDINTAKEISVNASEMKLNCLNERADTENDETNSEISSLEVSISRLNSSVNALNDGICSMTEVKDLKLAHVKKTAKQAKENVFALERVIDALSAQMNSLRIKKDNIEKNYQKCENVIKQLKAESGKNETIIKEQNIQKKDEMSSTAIGTKETNRGRLFPCFDGWLLFRKHCYHYDKNNKRTFWSASDYCRESNAYIADVGSRSESKFIYGLTGKVYTWIGVRDGREENVWISERTNKVVTYTNWLRGDPDGGRAQNCVILGYRRYHKWIDAPCGNSYHFVCKKEAIPVK